MNVLSLFDGCAIAYESLKRAGIPVDNYYASEIDKWAIKIAHKNHPDIIQLGDIQDIDISELPTIDLLIGGSPCQDLSIAGRRKGLNGRRSGLFFKFVEIMHDIKPKWFILENVASMSKENKDIITQYMGVEPVEINSALVSAQNRKRLYWTNIPVEQPEDRGILLYTILEHDIDNKYYIKPQYTQEFIPTDGSSNQIGYIRKNHRGSRVYNTNGKSVTLAGEGGGWGMKTGLYVDREKSYCIDANYHKGTNAKHYAKHHKRQIVFKDQQAAEDLQKSIADGTADDYDNTRIRKLTPVECERLQTLPDNYTAGVSNTQRYRMLGNGFTVDVIAHILKGIQSDKQNRNPKNKS